MLSVLNFSQSVLGLDRAVGCPEACDTFHSLSWVWIEQLGVLKPVILFTVCPGSG